MAKNIEMQYYNGSTYEAVYPKTLSENVINKDGTTLEDLVNIFNYHTWFRTPYENKVITCASSYTNTCIHEGDGYYSDTNYDIYPNIGINIFGETYGVGNDITVNITYSNTQSNTTILQKMKNKYFKNKIDNNWYFVDSGSSFSNKYEEGEEPYKTIIKAKLVSIVDNTVNGTSEYVTSSSSSTYPISGKSGGYEYFYLGTPQQYLINKNIRIKMGAYTGTGSINTKNYPIELSFDFIPLIVFISQKGRNPSIYQKNQTSSGYSYGEIFWKNNKIYFYTTETTSAFYNTSGEEYYYLGIGY